VKWSRLVRMMVSRYSIVLGLALLLGSCRGFDKIPLQEAAWRRVQPELAGMSESQLWQCAGPPLRRQATAAGGARLIYRYADLDNYCQVSLVLDRGKVRSFTADHSAPDFFWLRDGSNYCGQIFSGCIH
jgi:hypothetical protein